jgi:hypothetical protein
MKTRPFSPGEIGAAGAPLLSAARMLEEYASRAAPAPPAHLTDRIMSSIAREQAPTPPVLLVRALRNRSVEGTARYLALSLQAALGVRHAFPLAVRAQAIAVVLVAVIVLGGGGVALAAGAANVAHALLPAASSQAPAVKHSRPVSHGMSHGKRVRQHGPKSPHAKSPDVRWPKKAPDRRGPAAIDNRGSDGKSGGASKVKTTRDAGHSGSRD